jgi:hypothetical protein
LKHGGYQTRASALMNPARSLWFALVCLATGAAPGARALDTNWNPRAPFLRALVAGVPAILASQNQKSGRFGTEPWICDDQNVIFPLAAAWSLRDPANPYYHDAKVLEAVMRGGDALVAAQDKHGLWEFRKKDNSTWGQTAQPWTYSRWVRAFQLVKDAMPAKRRAYWEQGLRLGFERIAKSLPGERSHNKPCHLAMALYCAGMCFERDDWKQVARDYLAKVVAAQSPFGCWSEHCGPVVGYNFVYVDALGTYYAMSHDAGVMPALQRAAGFHTLFTYPNGSPVETVDERNPYHQGIVAGNVGFSFTPAGRGFLLHQSELRRWGVEADTAASFLLYGATGPAAPMAADRDELTTVVGQNQALVWRRKPWFICLSAFVCEQATNRWIQDRQNFVSIFHDRVGLIAGGGNTKLQPLWSSFTVGNTARLRHKPGDENPDFRAKGDLIHIPVSARLQPDPAAPGLGLTYGSEECRLAVRPLDDRRLTLVCEATSRSRKPVEGHVAFLPEVDETLTTAAGKSVRLNGKSLVWTGADLGAWFQYGAVRVSVPPGAKLLWPMKRHNPYKKDGSSTLAEARLVLCLPFSTAVPKQEVGLEVMPPAKP